MFIHMLRTIIKPNTQRINLSIPSEYIGEEVEILVFPINDADNKPTYNTEERHARRQEAFQNFMEYKGALPADFNYKKELEDYRNERYDRIT